MCYSKDFNAQKFFHSKGEFLLLCGYKSSENGLMCRMVPYYPYMDIALSIDEFSIDTQHIIDSITSGWQRQHVAIFV
ncbi:hypothetical protein DICVIV_01127 [Dictyocaulus viviparus]|uniref:Uncharacterized protein n=1 Tax=Dictyocaulus viviparus TaxID=29172 RepID=A0A0D8YDH3_DICVI|nr:hypothetical protein DICVIV_01127 [Dictyocaulus viviparus]